MLKRLSAGLISILLITTIQTPTVHSVVKAGSVCKKVGTKSIVGKLTFTCVKSGKKLIWNKGTSNSQGDQAQKSQTPISKLSEPNKFLNHEPCRIVDGDPALTNMTAGFPIPAGRIDLRSGANIQVIGVDFVDKKGGASSPEETYGSLLKGMEKFWLNQASVPVKISTNWSPKWHTMPNPIKNYQMGGSFFEGKFIPDIYFNFAKNIIAQKDNEINFQGINLLILVFPQGISNQEIGTFLVHTQGVYGTNEESITNLIMAGGDYANLDTYIHEFGHAIGLTDIRDTTDLMYQQSDGMYFDVMNNPTYPELLFWHRYLLGIVENSQLHCITSSEASIHWLVPVAKDSKALKGVVIPLSSTEAVIVESRRAIGYDVALSRRSDLVGAVVYSLDSKVPYRRTPVKVIKVLKDKEEITTNGYKIKVIESGDFGDVIQVEKIA